MKLNNHVPHNLKKRYLKKHGENVKCHVNTPYKSTVGYYLLIDTLRKDIRVEREAYRYLQKRLRVKGVTKSATNAFTGNLYCDFIWDSTEYGHRYWSRLNAWIHQKHPNFVSILENLNF